MVMWTATKNTKCCATCANWGGERKATSAKSAETPHTDTRGKCYAGVFSSVTQGQCACEGRSCPKYQMWGALK